MDVIYPKHKDLFQDEDDLHQRSRLGHRSKNGSIVGFFTFIHIVFSFCSDIDL